MSVMGTWGDVWMSTSSEGNSSNLGEHGGGNVKRREERRGGERRGRGEGEREREEGRGEREHLEIFCPRPTTKK